MYLFQIILFLYKCILIKCILKFKALSLVVVDLGVILRFWIIIFSLSLANKIDKIGDLEIAPVARSESNKKIWHLL